MAHARREDVPRVATAQGGKCLARAWSFFSTMFAIVDFPEPDKPVNHRTTGFCAFWLARASLSMSMASQWMFDARRSAKFTNPIPTVL